MVCNFEKMFTDSQMLFKILLSLIIFLLNKDLVRFYVVNISGNFVDGTTQIRGCL